jgi:isohexenylglutaconyl-CoA hydratase
MESIAYRHITLRRSGIALHLTFNRPERRNALNHVMMAEIGDAVRRVARDREARALVLRGAGGAFCAGGDLGAMAKIPAGNYRRFGDVLVRLNRLPQAVIAVVEGPAVGGGFGMACCADVVILHSSAKFGIPEPRAGFIPSQVLPMLVRRLGEGRVRRLAVTGNLLGAEAAREAGLGHVVCRSGAALERALTDVLADVKRMEPGALATVKRLVALCSERGDKAVMDRASRELLRLLRRPQAKAGMRAFLEKKLPPWAV